ncbi:YDG domain-containing protein [Parasediminibacterium sp. JCM 36343]|uniref:YDG domain-containing protein n=1 Tax=Parasediminibacterium sp. JCM 36343 TaxID=3374279 RepID=UPI00397811DD
MRKFSSVSATVKSFLAVLTFLAALPSISIGQQVIGSFPVMDGGFEAQTAGTLGTSVSSSAWSRQSVAGSTSSIVTTTPRSGSKYATVSNVATATRGLQSPQDATPANGPAASTAYIVQFFIKNASAMSTYQASVNTNGTSNTNYITSDPGANASWTKKTIAVTSASTAVTSAGILILGRTSAISTFDIDDAVIYAGASADVTAPNAATSAVVGTVTSSTIPLTWTAPTGGVDGGGYVVVRYATSPNSDNTPNQNGIYAVGNTTTNGTGSLVGTIVYVGTTAGFTDASLTSGTTYYYKIYAVDKAFNYSAELATNGTTTGGGTPTISTTGTLSAVSTTYGTATTTPTSFSVSGASMTAGITVTPPSGFEVSQTVGGASGYAGSGNAITVGSSGTIASTTVYVRLAAAATFAGSPYSGNVVCTSSGASTVNVATASSTVTKAALTITGITINNKVFDNTTGATIAGTAAYSGLVNGESFSVTGSPTAVFTSSAVANNIPVTVSGYTAPSTNYSLTQPTGLTANITAAPSPTITGAATATAFTTTYGTVSTAQTFSVSGANLTANLVATAPTGFEVSSDGTTYGSTATFTQTSGSASGTLSIRLSTTAVPGGTFDSQNIVLSSTGATSVNIVTAASGNAVSTKALTVTGISIPDKTYDGTTTGSVTGTATLSGVINSDVVTVGGTITATFASSAVANGITVTLAGYTLGGANASYYTVTQPSLTGNIVKASQTITFGALVDRTNTDIPTFSISATASSAGAVTFASSNTAVATVSGTTVTIVGVGTTTITASQSGTTNYNAAPDVPQTLNVLKTLAGFDVSGQAGGVNSYGTSPLTANTSASGITVGGLTRGSGFGTTGTGAGNAWGGTATAGGGLTTAALALAANNFATFSVAVASNYTASLSSIAAYNIRRSATGPTSGQWQYQIGAGAFTDIGTTITWGGVTSGTGNLQPAISLTGISALQNLAAGTTVTFRVIPFGASSTGTWYINGFATSSTYNDLIVTGTATAPDITVLQGASTLTSGSGSYTFGNITYPGSSSAVTFTVSNPGTSALSLSGSPAITVSGTNASDFSVNQTGTSATVPAGGTTTYTVTFTPSSLGAKTATISIGNNVTGKNPYTYTVTGTGSLSATSDIVNTSGYTYTQNLAYMTKQAATGLTTANTISVQGLTIRDGGSTLTDTDVFGTDLTSLTFSTGGSTAIRSAALFSGSTNIAEVAVNGATTISFPSISGLTAPDGGTKNFELRVTFLKNVTDNQQITFTVTAASSDPAGSGFAATNAGGAVSSTTSNINRLEVTATKLIFVAQPPVNTVSHTAMASAVTVRAVDDSSNVDLDFISNVTISSTGTLSSGNIVVAASSGLATFSSITHNDTSINNTLTAAAAGVTSATSTKFNNIINLVTWSFDNATDGTASFKNSKIDSALFSAGNQLGATAPSPFIGSTSPSTTYAGASGSNNASSATITGALTAPSSPANTYFQFTIYPTRSYKFSLTSVSFGSISTSTGPQAFTLRSSLDNYTADLAIGTMTNTSTWVKFTPIDSTPITSVIGTAVTYRIYGYNGAGGASAGNANWRVDDVSANGIITFDPAPIIYTSVTTLPTSFTQTVTGIPSATQSYTVSADYLDNNVTVTAPIGYQISSTSATAGFASSLTLNRVGGSGSDSGNIFQEPVIIYVRLNTSTLGTIAGNVTNTSTGAITGNVAVTGTRTIDYYNVAGGIVSSLSSWSTNTNGIGGTAPSSFTAAGQTFHVNNGNVAVAASTAWTVSGGGSKVVLGNGTNTVSLTVPQGSKIISTIDLANNSTLKLQDTAMTQTYGTQAVGSTIEYAQTIAYSVPSAPSPATAYNNLKISGAGMKTFASGSTTISGNLTLSNTVLQGNASFSTLAIGGNISYTGTVTPPSDALSVTLSLTGIAGSTQTISGDGVALVRWFSLKTNNANTIVLSKTGSTNLNLSLGNASGGGTNLATGSILNLNGNDITFVNASSAGGATFTGSGTITSSSTSNWSIFKTTGTAITALPLTPGSNTIKDFTLNYTGGTITLASPLGIYGVLSVNAGTFATAGLLTMKSTSIATSGTVAAIPASGASITGDVTVERYIPKGYRSYRDIVPSVYKLTNTIYNQWMEGGSYANNGYGMFITGGAGVSGTTATPNSIDPTTHFDVSQNGVKTAYTYIAGVWDTIPNTDQYLDPFQGHRMLIRGDRSFNLYGTSIDNTPLGLLMYNATTLRAKGSLVTGTVKYDTTGVTHTPVSGSPFNTTVRMNPADSGFSLVANPYVCPVAWSALTKSNLVTGNYYFLKSTAGATGVYVAATSLTYPDIQAGQAFFVQNVIGSGRVNSSITFTEAAKDPSSTHTSIFGGSSTSYMPLSLWRQVGGGDTSYHEMDEATIIFDTTYSNAPKFAGSSDNLAIKVGNSSLSINARKAPTKDDTINLLLSSFSKANYQLQLDGTNFNGGAVSAYLYDNYLKTTTLLKNELNAVSFMADNTIAASYANRFSIIFKPTILPISNIVLNTALKNDVVSVDWSTIGMAGVVSFDVEKSLTGTGFAKVATVAAKASTAAYSYSDASVATGSNYYRIKALSATGEVAYSAVSVIKKGALAVSYSFYPNPVTSKMVNLQLGNVEKGVYTVSLYNSLGQKVSNKTVQHQGGSATYSIGLGKALASGVYTVSVHNASGAATYQASLSVE